VARYIIRLAKYINHWKVMNKVISEWWIAKSMDDKINLCKRYYGHTKFYTLTHKEIKNLKENENGN